MKTIPLWILLFWCGAAAANALPQDADDFRALVESTTPIGMPILVAQSRIESLGLTCTLMRRGWTNNIYDRTEYYFCQRQSGKIVLTRWRVSMLPNQEKVDAVRADVVLVGP